MDPRLGSAIRARAKNPTAENQGLLDEAWQAHEVSQERVSRWFAFAIILITASGFFIGGRELERQRIGSNQALERTAGRRDAHI